MIPVYSPTLDTNRNSELISTALSWQKQMACSLKTLPELLSYLNMDLADIPYQVDLEQPFQIRTPRFFADLIDRTNPFDPLLLQVISQSSENSVAVDTSQDPLNEESYTVSPGLIHKYNNRALLIAHQACAVHCRYCFRRHFPYESQRLSNDNLKQAIEYLKEHAEINEIILSGGDPLSLSDAKIRELLIQLAAVPSLKTIRIHSRTPVVLPDRITAELVEALKVADTTIVFVLHINHSQEISLALKEKVQTLRQNNILVLNQTVLLKQINDDVKTLVSLSNDLFQAGILPYYLHTLDPVQGAGHFGISLECARSLWHTLQAEVSGYLLPRLVTEVPGKSSKTWQN